MNAWLFTIATLVLFALPVARVVAMFYVVPRWRRSAGPGQEVFFWKEESDNFEAMEGVLINSVEPFPPGPHMLKVSGPGYTEWVSREHLYPRNLLWLLG